MNLVSRLKDSLAVLNGKKTTLKPVFFEKFSESVVTDELRNFISATEIEFVFSEFGETRVNAGGSIFNTKNRLDPTFSSLQKYFPSAKFTVYSDFDLKIDGVTLKKVQSPVIDPEHPRFLYRTADYFKFKGLAESTSQFACVMDTDMLVCNENVFHLVWLTKTFGFCVPENVRNLMKTDMEISLDTQKLVDASGGFGHSFNQSPMTLWNTSENGRKFYNKCCEIMQRDPSRASLVMWKASVEIGINPYLLPKQWCVCTGQEGIGNEVLLHVGHPSVAEYYNIKL